MKHIKKFESFEDEKFDLGNYPVEDQNKTEEECTPCEDELELGSWEKTGSLEDESDENDDESQEEDAEEERRRLWGDEATVERISSFENFLSEAKKSKGVSYKKSGLKHPEKADLNKDKKISRYEKKRGKAVQDAVQDEKEEKGGKGLTAAQKKLPEGLRKAIEAKKKK